MRRLTDDERAAVLSAFREVRKPFDYPAAVLGEIERQKKFLLDHVAMTRQCPACHAAVTECEAAAAFDADGRPFAETLALTAAADNPFRAYAGTGDAEYACPGCGRQLRFCLPFVGPGRFDLAEPLTYEP